MPLARGSAFRCLERPRIDPHELQAVCSCREGVRAGHRYHPKDAKHDRGRELRRLSSSGSGVRVVGLAVDRDQSGCKYHSRGCYSLPCLPLFLPYMSICLICHSAYTSQYSITTPERNSERVLRVRCGAARPAISVFDDEWAVAGDPRRARTNKQRSARSLSRERYNI